MLDLNLLLNIFIFLGNCCPTVGCDIIYIHIFNETGITTVVYGFNQVIEYKNLIHDRDNSLDLNVWPIGIKR